MEKINYRIYVVSLASYNHGYITGEWIDLEKLESLEDLKNKVNFILQRSKIKGEEYLIADCENISFHEYTSLSIIWGLCELMKEHNHTAVALYNYYRNLCDVSDYLDNSNITVVEEKEELAYYYAENFLPEMYEKFQEYINWEAVMNTVETSSTVFQDNVTHQWYQVG